MIIFEALPRHLKIHSHYRLLDPDRESEFSRLLGEILSAVNQITGLGVSGFMKMPYKDTRFFHHRTAAGALLPQKPPDNEWLIQGL